MGGKLRITMNQFYSSTYGEMSYNWLVKVNDEVFDTKAFDGTYDSGSKSNCIAYLEISYNLYKMKFLGTQAKQFTISRYSDIRANQFGIFYMLEDEACESTDIVIGTKTDPATYYYSGTTSFTAS